MSNSISIDLVETVRQGLEETSFGYTMEMWWNETDNYPGCIGTRLLWEAGYSEEEICDLIHREPVNGWDAIELEAAKVLGVSKYDAFYLFRPDPEARWHYRHISGGHSEDVPVEIAIETLKHIEETVSEGNSVDWKNMWKTGLSRVPQEVRNSF